MRPTGPFKNSEFIIYSIKRLSDGEVFTIGDRVHQVLPLKDDNTWIIKEFSTKDTRCFTIGVNITCIEKAKTPIFTTEDGVEIFEGDSFWILESDFTYYKCNEPAHSLSGTYSERKYFSTKEKAEEYVLLNKPCISINDIIKYGFYNFLKTQLTINEDNLKSLVKSKL
jgi:hypothetical protein